MALPSDRNSLIEWCLRKLGEPVIQVNVDEQQLENLTDEALELFREYHVDGTGLFFKPFRVSGSALKVTAPPSVPFTLHEDIIGGTSGAKGQFEYYDQTNNQIVFIYKDRTNPIPFQNGEIVTGFTTGASATLVATDAVILGNMDKKYLDLDDSVIGISEILKTRSTFGSHPINPFDLQYQLAQQVTIQTFLNADVVTYRMFQQDIELWDQLFVGKPEFWHSRKQNRLYIDCSWPEKFRIGEYIVIKYWGAIDPTEFPKVYSDKWLRKYLCALIEEQWGQNIGKYRDVQLPGGLVLNGDQIAARAEERKEKALLELRSTFEQRVGFKIG